MGLMQHQDAYFPEETTTALSAYAFSGTAECLGWSLKPAGKERMQQKNKEKRSFLKSPTLNVLLVLI